MSFASFALTVSIAACRLAAGPAEAPAGPAAWLERDILGRGIPLAEVQAFTEARVAPVPPAATPAAWVAIAGRLRREVLDRVVFRGEAASWRRAKTRVEWLERLDGGPGYRIRKLRYEALPGLWIPALLYEPDRRAAPAPAALNVNGHERRGKAIPYKQIRCINEAKRGIVALNTDWLGMGQLATPGFRHGRMNQLDLCGTSGLAPFYLALERAIDVLLDLDGVDPARVAVAGLSGGGWQTIVLSALDERVHLANPVAGYSSFRTRARHLSDLGDSEQTPVDLASIADYTTLTAMRAPRPTLLTYNAADDCCFAADHALPPLLEAARPVFEHLGHAGALRRHINRDPGTHNFERDNREALYRALADFGYFDARISGTREIPCEGEILSEEALRVALPAPSEDFHTLALKLSRRLPRAPAMPQAGEAAAWRRARRAELREIVRARPLAVEAHPAGRETAGGLAATFWRLRVGGAWTIPAVEIAPPKPARTVVLLADGGRASPEAAAEAGRCLAAGARVVALDPFTIGESSLGRWNYLFALLVSSVGDRPLGLQANQIAATARWIDRDRRLGPVTLDAVGPRAGVWALVAAALEEEAVAGVTLRDGLASLREVIKKDWSFEQAPELFCFGLLASFDLEHLAALIAPRPVTRR